MAVRMVKTMLAPPAKPCASDLTAREPGAVAGLDTSALRAAGPVVPCVPGECWSKRMRRLPRPRVTPNPRRSPMGGRFWISVVVIFVVSMLIGFAVHGVVLHDDYAQLPNLMRTEADAQGHFGYMILAHVCMALGFTWIYRKGRESGKPATGQGL